MINNLKKRTKIVATIGPASEKFETLQKLYEAGVNVFRLNFSHGIHEEHGEKIDNIKKLKAPVAIMLDTKGPEIRTGEVRDKLPLKVGDKFIMTIEKGVYEDTKKISVNYVDFINDVDVGDIIVFDSGVLLAKAIKKDKKDIYFEVIEGQTNITTKRHINLLGKTVTLPTITEQDWKDIDFGIEKKVDFIALSFVRSGEDVVKVREYCKNKGVNIQIISKIENFESTQNLENIVMESDAIMVARGDLACEISFAKVPGIQKKIVALCSLYNKPVIIATQMLLSMVDNIQPTRAEVSDVANAIFEQVDAVMTSDETTKGFDPVHVIKIMSKIVQEVEDELYSECFCDNDCEGGCQDDKNNCKCSGEKNYGIISLLPEITSDIKAVAVIRDDEYAKNISAARINLPIYFFTEDEILVNQSSLIWNVHGIFEKKITDNYLTNLEMIDKFFKQKKIDKYLIIFDLKNNNKSYPTIQIREI